MIRLTYSREAVADIDAITGFSIEQFGRDVADGYLVGLEAACELLREFPELAPVHPGVRPSMRCLVYRSHRIFYRVGKNGILIVRILHHARDTSRSFPV